LARTLSYQVAVLTLGRLFSYAVMFFIPIVNTRALTVEDLGTYRQFWLIFDTVSVFLIMGFPMSLLYYFPRSESRDEKSIYLTQTVFYLLLAGVLSWGVFGVLDVALGEGLGALVGEYFWQLCLFTFFMIVAKYMERLFVADRQAERQAVYHAVSYSVQAVVVMSIAAGTRRVETIVWGLLIFSFVKFAFALIYTASAYRLSPRLVSRKTFKQQVSYAVPLGMSSVVLLFFSQTDKYVIIHYLGREAFAVYSIGALQIPFIDIVRNSIYNVAMPMMAQYQKEGRFREILDLWHRAVLKTAVLFFPIFIFLEVSARPFVTILFTEQYADATPIAMAYFLIFLASTIETGSVLTSFGRTALMFKINVVGFLTHIGFSILMFKTFGREGVPFATVTIIYCQNAVRLFMGGRLLGVSFFRVMPWGKLALRFVTALVPGLLLLWGYRYYAVDHFVELALAGVIYFGIYFAVCFRARFITWPEIKSMFGRV
jgi:O-antigen/teichoic acid export membrane protein